MSNKKKERTIAGFSSVAGDNVKAKNSNSDNDLINDILETNKPKEKTHVFKGYYLENEVARVIDTLTDGKPKGTKSEFINGILKKYFKENDLM